MKTCPRTKLIHSGEYVGEVDVTLIGEEEGWAPYLSIDDAATLDVVKEALDKGDLKKAATLARVYRLTPVEV